jgi:hypothetical protein
VRSLDESEGHALLYGDECRALDQVVPDRLPVQRGGDMEYPASTGSQVQSRRSPTSMERISRSVRIYST